MLSTSSKGFFKVLAAAVLFGLIGVFVKLIRDMSSGSIIFYRMLIGLTAVSVFLVVVGRFGELRLKGKKVQLLMLGLFQAAAMLLYFTSIRYTSLATAVLLLYTAPIYVTLLSPLLLKERFSRWSLVALALSLAGVILVIRPEGGFLGPGKINPVGVTLGLVAGFLYGLMTIASRHLRDEYSGVAQGWWAILITMAVFLPHSGDVSAPVLLTNLHWLVLFGLLPTALGLLLYLDGLRSVRAQTASVMGLIEPVSSVVLAALILHEPILPNTLLGGGLILFGVGIVSRTKS